MGKDNYGTIASVPEDLNELIWGTPFFIQWEASLDSRAITETD
jgi:hypothetical protein